MRGSALMQRVRDGHATSMNMGPDDGGSGGNMWYVDSNIIIYDVKRKAHLIFENGYGQS